MSVLAKICGLKSAEAVHAALEGGAAYVGFVFFAPSPRDVGVEVAAGLAAPARGRARIVALAVDPDDAAVEAIVAGLKPDFLQLHGTESPQRVAAVKARWGVPVIKAIKVADRADLSQADAYDGTADLILFDAKPPPASVLPGGNGQTFDWGLLEGVRRRYMLSGGLTPDNVADAIRQTKPYAVDVSSGVERRPGEKDIAAIRRFLAAVKAC